MQSFDTKSNLVERLIDSRRAVDVCPAEELALGSCKTIELPNGREIALYNINGINGEFYATENSCPHKGAPLAERTNGKFFGVLLKKI